MAVAQFPQHQRPTIPQLRNKMTELVPGIKHGQRLHLVRHPVARQQFQRSLIPEVLGIQTQFPGQAFIHADQIRVRQGLRGDMAVESLTQAGETSRRFQQSIHRGMLRPGNAWRNPALFTGMSRSILPLYMPWPHDSLFLCN